MAVGDRLENPQRGPEPGTIETYDVADNLGRIRVATGEVVRFGKTACKGFEPAVGVKVHVVAASPHPRGGLRAETVVLDPGDAEYAQKVAARDSRAAPAHPQRQGAPPPPRPKRDVDAQLLRRLGNIAGVNAMVRGGQDPAQIYLVPNYNAERVLEAHRPRVGFRFDVERVDPDRWRIVARIDGPMTLASFCLDLSLPEMPPLDPATFDTANAPGIAAAVSNPPGCERNPLARSWFLLNWRVEGAMDESSLEEPLEVEAVVMGVELTRLPHSYVLAGPDEHWVLLKCLQGDQCLFFGLDLSSGEGEVFPRRYDADSYRLALNFVATFT